jgi:hypothetical protein
VFVQKTTSAIAKMPGKQKVLTLKEKVQFIEIHNEKKAAQAF